VSLPAAIQKQVEEAERIQAALAGTPEPAPTESEPAPAAAEDSTPTPTGESTEKPTTQPPAELRPKKSFDKDDDDTWRQRYFGLQGVFNAQVPALQQQVKDLAARLAAAEAQARQPTPTAAEKTATPRVTEKDVEAFGSDLIDVIDRKAQEVVERQATAYEGRIAELEQALAKANAQLGNVTQTQVQNSKERFFAHLDSKVPNWNEVQGTSEAQEWLGTKVPGTQWTWDDVLKDAAANHDGTRAVEVFNQLLKAYPQFAPPAGNTKSGSRELQRQVAPAKSSSASAPSPSGTKRIFTAAEFGSEMDKVIRLNMQGKYDEAKRIESELNAAMADGRIRP